MEIIEAGAIGAVVADVHLSGDLSATELRTLLDLWSEHPVLVFPGQHFDDERQVAFTSRLGALETYRDDAVIRMSTIDAAGAPLAASSDAMQLLAANEGWHADSSHHRVSAAASLLSARLAPPSGGATEWADMRAAYDALDPDTRATAEGLVVVHEYAPSDDPGLSAEFRARYAPCAHPLVRTHPVTGRRCLYAGYKLSYVLGQDPTASRAWLRGVTERACQDPRIFRYRLATGDAVLWDNVAVLHRSTPCPPRSARVVHRTTVIGDRHAYPSIPDVVLGFEDALAATR